MHLQRADIDELAAALPLRIDLSSYRERLTPLAIAVLEGAPRRTIEKRRELVLPDVWDANLRRGALEAVGRLRVELERKLSMLDEAVIDIERLPRTSKLAPAIVDRVLAELLEHSDENIAALEALERELESLAVEDRAAQAALAARGAGWVARIPANELRAAIVRIARSNHDRTDAEALARQTATVLATDERRDAVRQWARELGAGSVENAPLLAECLQALAVESAVMQPDDDLLWIQACIGLAFEFGLAHS